MLNDETMLASDVAFVQRTVVGTRAKSNDDLKEKLMAGFKGRLAMLREEYGVTQAAVVRLTMLDKGAVSRIFKGETIPDLATVERICAGLRLRRDWFIGGHHPIFTNNKDEPDPAWSGFEGDRRRKQKPDSTQKKKK